MTVFQHDAIIAAIPGIKKLYEDAGYEHALELEDKVNSVLKQKYGEGANVFDTFPIWKHAIEAADCFHSGTWQIWNDDGEIDLLTVFDDNFTDEDDIDHFLYDYEVSNVLAIEKFIKIAETWLGNGHVSS